MGNVKPTAGIHCCCGVVISSVTIILHKYLCLCNLQCFSKYSTVSINLENIKFCILDPKMFLGFVFLMAAYSECFLCDLNVLVCV